MYGMKYFLQDVSWFIRTSQCCETIGAARLFLKSVSEVLRLRGESFVVFLLIYNSKTHGSCSHKPIAKRLDIILSMKI